MTTPAKIEANRRNAQHSTGPRTPEGKAASSANSVTHGYTAHRIFVPEGEREQYQGFAAELEASVRPVGGIEKELFDRLLLHGWNLRYVRLAEVHLIVDQFGDISEASVEHRLQLYARYRRDLERAYDRAFHELERLQSERVALAKPPAEAPLTSLKQLATLRQLLQKTDYRDEPTPPAPIQPKCPVQRHERK
jgi:hypothetical protein